MNFSPLFKVNHYRRPRGPFAYFFLYIALTRLADFRCAAQVLVGRIGCKGLPLTMICLWQNLKP